jgi:tRNA-guanine family transglycosylase
MKYFICWYPDPPDPRYWDWFPVDGLMVSLSTLFGESLRKAMNIGLHRLTGFKGPIFLDAGLFRPSSSKNMSQEDILNLQSWLKPDYVAHMDFPVLPKMRYSEEEKKAALKKTINNARVAERWAKSNDDVKIVYVIQGWDKSSFEFCAKQLAKIGAEHYGLGSLYRAQVDEIKRRVRIVRKHIGLEPLLHLFGVSPLTLYREKYDNIGVHRIDSVDSSAPILAGVAREVLNTDSYERDHIYKNQGACTCPVCIKYPSNRYMNGLEGRKRLNNRIRAIHNAYWYNVLAHQLY